MHLRVINNSSAVRIGREHTMESEGEMSCLWLPRAREWFFQQRGRELE